MSQEKQESSRAEPNQDFQYDNTSNKAAIEPKGSVPLGVHPNNVVPFPRAEDRPVPDTDDEAINKAIAEHQAGLESWKPGSRDLTTVARKLIAWAEELWDEFIPRTWKNRRVQRRPVILLGFKRRSLNNLGHYRPGRNDFGLRYELNINPLHLTSRSEIQVAGTLLHELLHCVEEITDSLPKSRNNYHSSAFRRYASKIGIPCTKYGGCLGERPDSPFVKWAERRGLKGTPMLMPLPPEEKEPEEKEPPRPKRVTWTCQCPDDVRVSVLVPRGSELKAKCERCYVRFEMIERHR